MKLKIDLISKTFLSNYYEGYFYQDQQKGLCFFCDVTRNEISKIKRVINQIDKKAFVTVQHLSEISGSIIHNPLSPRFKPIDSSITQNRTFDEDKRDS